ncbi:MAG: sensor histidine kinase [Actinobacteria bacterium]|nr:sensor histidine kinase [Actinomycetota bacterium]
MNLPRPRPLDVLIAAVCAAAMVVEAAVNPERAAGFDPLAIPLALLAAAPLAWRRSRPIGALLLCVPGLIAFLLLVGPAEAATATAMIALYTAAERGDRRRSILIAAIAAVFLGGLIWLLAAHEETAVKALRLLILLSPIGVGEIVRTRRELGEAEEDRREALEHEREEEARRRVAAERVRIARELHDSLGHALVAIDVRAGVARHLGDPESAATALAEIQAVSGEALGELRGTIDLLRESGEPAPTRPGQGLDGVPELIETLRAGGVEADARFDLGATELPRSLGLVAYRIVQESFTNILRHADAARATLEVRVVGRRLEIEVTDDGTMKVGATAAPGHGLRGMAERAEALGGSVEAGPAGGGWRVRAALPLDGGLPA